MIYYTTSYYIILYYTILYFNQLFRAVTGYVAVYRTAVYQIPLYCKVLYGTVRSMPFLYKPHPFVGNILCCDKLYCIVLYCRDGRSTGQRMAA